MLRLSGAPAVDGSQQTLHGSESMAAAVLRAHVAVERGCLPIGSALRLPGQIRHCDVLSHVGADSERGASPRSVSGRWSTDDREHSLGACRRIGVRPTKPSQRLA